MKPAFQRLRHWMWLPVTVFALLIGASEGGGGVTGTGSVACGAISDFGSIFVNEVEYFTNTANITIDGAPAQESQLRVGMQVRVEGLIFGAGATGQAATVKYDPDVRGAIDAPVVANATGAFFTVDGVGVQATDRTFVDGALGAGQLSAGDRVEVSGFRDENTGNFVATRVTRNNVAPGTVLSGHVSSVTASTFVLGTITVTYDSTMLRDAPASGLADGMPVRVKSPADPSAGVLAAAEVRVLDGLRAAAGTEASASGVVSGLTTSTFFLAGIPVSYDGTTRFRNGTLADLANGAQVEAEGIADANGVLVAQKVTFPAGDNAAADATVTAITANGFTLLSSNGVQVAVRADTKWKDKSAAKLATFGLAQLNVGDRVMVTGSEVSSGVVSADTVTRNDASTSVFVAGRARSVAGNAAVVVATQAIATAGTVYRDADGSVLTADAFFAKAAGRTVKASGVLSGSQVVASELDIEP
ncbi:MAG: DUF5666 domain-containing protein [Betaproteobacteria bacterium]